MGAQGGTQTSIVVNTATFTILSKPQVGKMRVVTGECCVININK